MQKDKEKPVSKLNLLKPFSRDDFPKSKEKQSSVKGNESAAPPKA